MKFDGEKALVGRLNKRITILRPPRADEWQEDAGRDESYEYDDVVYPSRAPGQELFNYLIEPAAPARNEFGELVDDWIGVCTIWAAIEPLQGREFFSALQENAEVTTRIRIRYRAGIDRTMIVRHGDQEFEILYIINPELGKRELQLMCKERQ